MHKTAVDFEPHCIEIFSSIYLLSTSLRTGSNNFKTAPCEIEERLGYRKKFCREKKFSFFSKNTIWSFVLLSFWVQTRNAESFTSPAFFSTSRPSLSWSDLKSINLILKQCCQMRFFLVWHCVLSHLAQFFFHMCGLSFEYWFFHPKHTAMCCIFSLVVWL